MTKDFIVRMNAESQKVLDLLASDHLKVSFTKYRLFTIKDKALYPKDWKKRTKPEKERWIEETQKRFDDQLKGIEKEVTQLTKYLKTLNK
jgi:hypothetical protein